MPTYEYLCRECGHSFDEYQRMTADPLVVCPNCGKHALKRVMGTGGGLIFKGSGFYQTDYKKNGSSPSGSTSTKKPEGLAKEKKEVDGKPVKSDSADTKSNSSEAKSGESPKKSD
ncbi:MAG TPA: zinc ribbon domain-containing protein [Bacteroidota bacterium]